MGAIVAQFLKFIAYSLAGLGVGKILDKVVADKVPDYEPVTEGLIPGSVGFKPLKLVFTVVALVLGAMILVFVSKKLKIKFLK